ncbi:MAG: class III poly(R)-hydroxyalkanoic acid synthase subunit PhaC [Pirellulales bacterium]
MSPDDPTLDPLVAFWSALMEQTDETARETLERIAAAADPQSWRRQWLRAVSQSLDAYMRSPPFLRAMSQAHRNLANSEAAKTWQRFLKPPDVAQATQSAVATTPHRVVYEEGTLKLQYYSNDNGAALAEPVLVCFALVNRPYILDLQPDRSVIRRLLQRGFDVYLIDWGVPASSDKHLRLHDYVCRFMKNVTDFVCSHSGATSVNLLGYCMGGTLAAMFASLYPELVRNLVLLAAPIDFSRDESLLNVWASEDNFNVDALIDAYGNCPGPFLQASFQMMRPVQSFHEKFIGFVERMFDDRFLENFFGMEQWANDSIPVAGEAFREFVKMLYRQNRLVEGQMMLNDEQIDLSKIVCPLLMLTADFDHLVSPGSTLALQNHVGSRDIQHMSIDAGHIGLAVSSKAHAQLWPNAAEWLATRSTPKGGQTRPSISGHCDRPPRHDRPA